MKFIKKILYLIAPLLFMPNVFAECDYSTQVQLSTDAANIKTKYEVATGELDKSLYLGCEGGGDDCDVSYNYYLISILNLTDNYYVKVTNDQDKTTKTFTKADANEDGIVEFKWDNVSNVTTFTFNIYSSSKTKCPNKKQTTKYLTTPRKNFYSSFDICSDMQDNYLCEEYVTYDNVDFDSFLQMLDEAKEKKANENEKNKSLWQKIVDFIVTYKWWFISGVVLVIVATLAVVTIIRKKNRI